ncbi:MAG: CDP-alcohol phosphatidyltransferase family protein [Candidatus Competibacterales bacterium]|nr:CDP-alcohol phosphatidyltransferase family protein [Candidatus Competibacterales bacterium]
MASSLSSWPGRRLAVDTAAALTGGLLVLSGFVWLVSATLEPGTGFILRAVGVYLLMAVLVWRWLPQHRPQELFGPANRVTLARLLLAALLAGAVGAPELTARLEWVPCLLALAALLLDALDGRLARRYRCASVFGARFDMETDAVLILVLTLLVWQSGVTGAWVVLGGLLRYLFVAAALPWPWLRAPLPPRQRRRVACAVQGGALVACLSPPLGPSLGPALAAGALLLLGGSFALDIVWLYRNRRTPA